jgi:murein L,D-transpeptidase YcbB/YkuD
MVKLDSSGYFGSFKRVFYICIYFVLLFCNSAFADIKSDFSTYDFQETLELELGSDNPIYKFFLKREFNPFWFNKNQLVNSLYKSIYQTEAHGLPKLRYSETNLKKHISELNYYQFEILATSTVLQIISDLYTGSIKPSDFSKNINIFANPINEELVLARFNDDIDLENLIFSYAPSKLEYTNLMLEKKRLEEIALNNTWGIVVPEDKFLGFNLLHPNVKILRSRLHKMGYIGYDTGSEHYDAELKSSVQMFQADFGLNDDGVAGKHTLQAINISAKTRLIQAIVNLERLRWNRFPKRKRYILVNQPNFQAYLYEDDEVVWQSRIVIGLPDHQTVEFNDTMTHMIINPTWHVPRSISIEEYLPIIQEDPEFLVDNEMVLLVRGTDKKIDPSLIDMSKFEPNNFPFEIKQMPSNVNALGVVKFMFPNKFNIYMHDTPMKELFFKDERTFSHGCVRLQDPFQFAHMLLKSQVSNPENTFQSVLRTKEETQINLKEGIPVNITYRTVFFDNYGQPQYRADIYGRDALLFMALQDAGLSTNI